MDLEIKASHVAKLFVKDSIDMNDSIAKIASEDNLNLDQLSRLIEESNKNAYLLKFAETGEQVFDIASLDKVRERYTPSIEKKAEVKSMFEFKSDATSAYGVEIPEIQLNKVAEEKINIEENIAAWHKAHDHCKDQIGSSLTKMADIRRKACYLSPSLEKCASEKEFPFEMQLKNNETLDKLAVEYEACQSIVEKYSKMKDRLLEKKAGLFSGAVGIVAKGAGAVGGKTLSVAAKHPMTTLNVGFGLSQAAKEVKKSNAANPVQKYLTNINPTLVKQASVGTSIMELLSEGANLLKPALPTAAAIGLIGAGSAGLAGIGSLTAKLMTDRKLEESFNTIISNNPDLAKNKEESKQYFDVIARHAPSLALDPLVAPQIMKQFDSFGGVDVQTVKNLREIEHVGDRGKDKSDGHFTKAMNFGSGLFSMSKTHKELKNN